MQATVRIIWRVKIAVLNRLIVGLLNAYSQTH